MGRHITESVHVMTYWLFGSVWKHGFCPSANDHEEVSNQAPRRTSSRSGLTTGRREDRHTGAISALHLVELLSVLRWIYGSTSRSWYGPSASTFLSTDNIERTKEHDCYLLACCCCNGASSSVIPPIFNASTFVILHLQLILPSAL